MALSSTYQSTGLPLLSTLYEPPPKHLISVLAEVATIVKPDTILGWHRKGVCVAMERKPGKCMLRILVIGIPERTQSTLRHRLWQRERVPSLEVDVFVDQG